MARGCLGGGRWAGSGARPGPEGADCDDALNGGTARPENGVAFLDGGTDKGGLVARLLVADDSVLCLALSPDGTKLASGGSQDRVVNVWDISAGADKAKLEQSIENHAA